MARMTTIRAESERVLGIDIVCNGSSQRSNDDFEAGVLVPQR